MILQVLCMISILTTFLFVIKHRQLNYRYDLKKTLIIVLLIGGRRGRLGG